MRTFKDSKGDDWQVEMSLLAAKRIEQADWSLIYDKPVRILNATEMDEDFFHTLLVDTSCIAALLWVMVLDQATERGISEDQFCARLNGPVLSLAKAAVWEEVADFFPEYKTTLLEMAKNLKLLQKKLDERMAARAPVMGETMDKLLDQGFAELDKKLDSPNGTGLASTK